MIKKLIFTVVLLLGLYLASVTALAANDDAIAPSTVFATQPGVDDSSATEPTSAQDTVAASDKGPNPFFNLETANPPQEANVSESLPPKTDLTMMDYIENYSDLFLNSKASAEDSIVGIKSYNHNDLSINPLSYVLSGSILATEKEIAGNPVVILFYIKEDGKYVPLYLTDVKDKKTNIIEKEAGLIFSYVDLLNIGADKTNDVRIVAFRKNDLENLELDKNLQIIDLKITVRKNNFEGVPFIFNVVINSLDINKK